jgi:hypothetical protein
VGRAPERQSTGRRVGSVCVQRCGAHQCRLSQRAGKLKHDRQGDVLLPLRPGDNLSYVAVKQIAAALGMQPEELLKRAR